MTPAPPFTPPGRSGTRSIAIFGIVFLGRLGFYGRFFAQERPQLFRERFEGLQLLPPDL